MVCRGERVCETRKEELANHTHDKSQQQLTVSVYLLVIWVLANLPKWQWDASIFVRLVEW